MYCYRLNFPLPVPLPLLTEGYAMTQVTSHRPLTLATSRLQATPCGICGAQSEPVTGFPPSISVFPCQYHSADAPYSYSFICHLYSIALIAVRILNYRMRNNLIVNTVFYR